MTINLELPKELGDLVMKAIDLAMASETLAYEKETNGTQTNETENNSSSKETSFVAKQADALVQIVRSYLSGGSSKGSDKKTSSSDNHQIIVHVDESALHGKGGKSDLPIESVRRLTCDTDIVEVTKDKKGNLLNLGRKHRIVSPQLKKALVSRDKSCRFPGCSHDKWLDAHHVMHWVDTAFTRTLQTIGTSETVMERSFLTHQLTNLFTNPDASPQTTKV